MDPNLLWFVSSGDESYYIYAIDISIATDEFDFSGNSLPPPVLELSKSVFPDKMTFQVFGSKLYMLGGERQYTRSSSTSDGTSFSLRPHNPVLLSTKVYTIDLSSVNLDLSMVREASPLSTPPKESPVVVVCRDQLYVISDSLNPAATTPLIEVLETEIADSWLPIHLPLGIVEQLSAISQSIMQGDDDDPYRVIAYATRGPEIVLRLSMFSLSDTTQIESLSLNTQTHSWSFVNVDPCGASYLPYPGRNLFLDSMWCESDTISEVCWMERTNWLPCVTTIPAPVHFDSTKVMEFGQDLLLALSYTTTDPNYKGCSAVVRVDYVRICDEYSRWNLKPKKTCRIVDAVNYLHYCSSSASSTRLHKVIYFYARPPVPTM